MNVNAMAQHAFAMASMGYGYEDIAIVTKIYRRDAKRIVWSVEYQRRQKADREALKQLAEASHDLSGV